jgi:hypothetical protein
MNPRIDLQGLEYFVARVENFNNLKSADVIDYLAYYLEGQEKVEFSAPEIEESFNLLKLIPYSNIRAYLRNNINTNGRANPKFIKNKRGYLLHRITHELIRSKIKDDAPKRIIKQTFESLLVEFNNLNENKFLKEAIDCFKVSAFRASIIMVWNLTIDHLYEYILKQELDQFNLALSRNLDKRIRIPMISVKDDFAEIPEGKFIELCRSVNIISNDVRKILEVKLGIRNTYAHPSNVTISESKTVDFIEDLIHNVILKYKIGY